jgi:hypothetical protein
MSGLVDDQPPVIVTRDKYASTDYGYILRDGSMYGCNYFGHSNLAARIFKYILNEAVEDPEKSADDAGWVRFTHSAVDDERRLFVTDSLSDEQRATISAWGRHHGVRPSDVEIFEK